MGDSVYVSYSAASRYKTCPTKYFLARRYQDRRISSALPFGKAVEMGVSAMLDGKDLATAQDIFCQHWSQEHVKGDEYRQIFDNLDLQFYASDFDQNLLAHEDEAQLDAWAEELLEERRKSWLEVFDDINDDLRRDKEVSDAQLAFYNRVLWTCCRIRGMVMLAAFHDEILPQVDLTKREHFCSQREVSMSNEDGDRIVGYVDYVLFLKDHGWVIIDLKTAANPYAAHALSTSEQLRTYVAAIGQEIDSRKAGYVVLIKKIKVDKSCNKCDAPREGAAKKCKKCSQGEYSKVALRGETQLIVREFQEQELEELLEDYMNVAVAIKNEVNYKNPEGCYKFGRQCEFYEHCWKRKALTEIPHLEDKKAAKEAAEGESE